MKNTVRFALLTLLFVLPQCADACTIPVFRYALEKWDLTRYEIMVYHRGPLPRDIATVLDQWNAAPNKANLDINIIGLDGKLTAREQKLWQSAGDSDHTPYMLVRYKSADPGDPSAWRGPCTLANLQSVLDSPMRQAILAHLTRGATTVWVLLTSEDAKADRAVCDLAMKELRGLEKRIRLPAQSEEGPKIQLPLPLKVSFPVLILDRTRPEEAVFIKILLATEDRLAGIKGPILFPIFGRGRVLGGLSDSKKEISREQISDVAKFLCRECSCQVKELNPGTDLLLVSDWREHFDLMYEGKEPVPMPAMMPASFGAVSVAAKIEEAPPRDLKPVEVQPIKASDATSQGSEFKMSLLPATDRVEIVTTEWTPEPPCCDLRFLLWLGAGFAGGLVLMTGGWMLCHLRK